MFNIGAITGREDSLKYAYDHNWFSVEECIKESDEKFQAYLDRGQNTLYSMDWDYQGYADSMDAKQYATLVDDADKKADELMEGIPEDILNQSMELSIPVYNDLPQYPIEDLRKYFE